MRSPLTAFFFLTYETNTFHEYLSKKDIKMWQNIDDTLGYASCVNSFFTQSNNTWKWPTLRSHGLLLVKNN